ncbi:DNA-binding protein D-ETS-3 [Sarcoptes scabiei]|nr:DNA-binding protein D-ETS-3 [Sarcoptes scabiei]
MKAKKPKRKLIYPNVSKDAVLKAYNQAVESNELPDFDEIDKFPLSIVTKAEEKSQMKKKSIRRSTLKKSKRISSQSYKDKNKKPKNIEKENIEASKLISPVDDIKTKSSPRRSLRKTRQSILKNNVKNTIHTKENNIETDRNLFDLNESCIVGEMKSRSTTMSKSSSNVGSRKSTSKIKSSTPFVSIDKASAPQRSTRNRALRSRGNLF